MGNGNQSGAYLCGCVAHDAAGIAIWEVAELDVVTAIKKIISGYLENEAMADVMHATYTGTGLKLDDRPNEIPAEFVDIPLALQSAEATVSGEFTAEVSVDGGAATEKTVRLNQAKVMITRGLAAGDRVTVVRQRGGQRYSIIDRTGD